MEGIKNLNKISIKMCAIYNILRMEKTQSGKEEVNGYTQPSNTNQAIIPSDTTLNLKVKSQVNFAELRTEKKSFSK